MTLEDAETWIEVFQKQLSSAESFQKLKRKWQGNKKPEGPTHLCRGELLKWELVTKYLPVLHFQMSLSISRHTLYLTFVCYVEGCVCTESVCVCVLSVYAENLLVLRSLHEKQHKPFVHVMPIIK